MDSPSKSSPTSSTSSPLSPVSISSRKWAVAVYSCSEPLECALRNLLSPLRGRRLRRIILLHSVLRLLLFVFVCFEITLAPFLCSGEKRRRRYLIDAMLTKRGFFFLDIFFFACSWGPVAWVVTGELYSLNVRAKCLSMTTATNWYENPLHELIFWKEKKEQFANLLSFFALQVTQLCNCKYPSHLFPSTSPFVTGKKKTKTKHLTSRVQAYSTPYMVNEEHANLQSKVFFIWGR